MRALSLLPIVLVVACDPPGLTLEVIVKPDVASVQLFIGTPCTEQCPAGIVRPDLGPKSVTSIYLVEDPAPWPFAVVLRGDHGVAEFRIDADSDTKLPIVVVAGFNAAGDVVATKTFHDVPISATAADYWQVHVVETKPISIDLIEPPPPAGTERIAHWQGPTKQLPACLLIEHWLDGGEPLRELVVPATDRDCDEVSVALECAPWVPVAMSAPATIDQASCLIKHVNTTTGGEICKLGGGTCNETSNLPSVACAPLAEDYCTPLNLCGCGPAFDAPCVTGAIDSGITASTLPFLRCKIPLEANGDACGGVPTRIDVDASVVFPSAMCTAMNVHALNVPLGPFESSIAIDMGTLAFESFATPCKATVVWTGNATSHIETLLVELELTNGKHLVVPAKVELARARCDFAGAECSFHAGNNSIDDGFYSCVPSSATPGSSCVQTIDCPYGPLCGPASNAICCGLGERCVSGVCTCGMGPECTDGDRCIQTVYNPDQCGTICGS